jgi:peptidoglycan/LPS O-acetylase OafA/YrhL
MHFVPEVLLALLYLTAFAVVAADARKETEFIRKLSPLGQLTYSSYMIHQLVLIVLVSGPVARLVHLRGVGLNLVVILAVLMLWPISYLSYVRLETPARRVLTRLLGARRQHPTRAI